MSLSKNSIIFAIESKRFYSHHSGLILQSLLGIISSFETTKVILGSAVEQARACLPDQEGTLSSGLNLKFNRWIKSRAINSMSYILSLTSSRCLSSK